MSYRRFLLCVLLLLLVPGGVITARAAAEALDDTPGPATRLEQAYSDRAGEPLRQYGYDMFDRADARTEPALGAVADSHVLGPGDGVTVTLRGQTVSQNSYVVGTDGLLIADQLRPVTAAGRTLGTVRAELEAEVAATLFDTSIFVSLSSPRRLSVLVVGEVRRPGRHDLSAFATVLDALFAAGGVARSGSLRGIRLIQPGGPAEGLPVDLYELLHRGGGAADRQLADGARIVVPPLGPTVAAAGQLQRPGIFELPPEADAVNGADLLALAGGPLRPGPARARLATIAADGSEQVVDLGDADRARIRHGDILLHAPARADRRRSVSLLGHVHSPGPRPMNEADGLSGLVQRTSIRDDAYLPFAVLIGIDPASGARRLDAVHAGSAMRGRDARPLADGDMLVLFGPADIAFLTSRAVLSLLAGMPVDPPVPACPGLAALATRLAADGLDGTLAGGALAQAAATLRGDDLPCPPLFAAHPDLLPMALQHAVLIRQGVLRPGLYPAAPGTDHGDLVAAAGGAPGPPGAAEGFAAGVTAAGIVDVDEAAVGLMGAVRDPGLRPLARATSLRALLAEEGTLADGAYGLLAVLERVDRTSLTRTLIPFAPADVLAGRLDRRLSDGDIVRILDRDHLRRLLQPRDGADPADPQDREVATGDPASERLEPALIRLLHDRSIRIWGEVAEPGAYPVVGTAEITALVAAAGGFTAEADTAMLEVVSGNLAGETPIRLISLSAGTRAEGAVQPGDSLRVPRRTPPPQPAGVLLAGEIWQPGQFDLAPGEKLSSVLARAGGLLPTAYPEGAIFTRDSARQAERQGLLRAAEELDRSMALMLLRPDPPDAARVELARRLSGELRAARAVGRITVEADPAVLAARPELDLVLEPGDRLYMPKRPLTITVSGEVLSPAALQFVPDKRPEDYLMEAGGLTREADDDRIFVLLPDGSARPLDQMSGRHGVDALPPGSTIVVPRDPEPFAFLPFSQSITTILSQLALTAVAITSLAD